MSYIADISNYYSVGSYSGVPSGMAIASSTTSESITLDMTDFLSLMVTELTNQSIDDTVDTTDMMNQMIMMQMVLALNTMTEAQGLSYTASLVGKEVTVADYDQDNNLQEVVGTVTGIGTIDGSQVIFLGDDYYALSSILAVGRLPESLTGTDSTTTVANTAETVDASAAADTAENSTKETVDASGATESVEETAETDTAEDSTLAEALA
jgi:flagellar basal-body rod modification protein FlgD